MSKNLVLDSIHEITRLSNLAKENKEINARDINLNLFSELVDELVKVKNEMISTPVDYVGEGFTSVNEVHYSTPEAFLVSEANYYQTGC